MQPKEGITLITVTADNVEDAGVYCIKNKKSQGYHDKIAWFKDKINNGLKIKIIENGDGKQIGFIEYISSEQAWRPVKAKNYYFIQCITVMSKKDRQQGIGKLLIDACLDDARDNGKIGACVMTSDGSWMANKHLFTKNGFVEAQTLDRFELLFKAIDDNPTPPEFHDWTKQQEKYKGWNLIYSDQCPWHEKSVTDLLNAAHDHGIDLKVEKINSPSEAQNGPSGFGTYALIKDGNLLSDHYISKTRFLNILKKES